MCSRKCANPFVLSASPRDPAPTQTLMLTDCAEGIGVVTTRKPSARVLTSEIRDMHPPNESWASRTVYPSRAAGFRARGPARDGGATEATAAKEPTARR